MSPQCDIEVEVSFLPTEHFGRRSPVFSDYRGQFYYDCEDWDARFIFPFNESVEPGETVVSYVDMLSPAAHLGRLCEGKVFLVREGNRVVGYGKVTKLVDLAESARRARNAPWSWRTPVMPEISRFFGMIVAMYYNDHPPPHFHVRYGEQKATIEIETLDVLDGSLGRRALNLVQEWATLHQNELRDDWNQRGDKRRS